MESIHNLMQLKAVRGQSVIDGTESTTHLGRIRGRRCMVVVRWFHAVAVTVVVVPFHPMQWWTIGVRMERFELLLSLSLLLWKKITALLLILTLVFVQGA